MDPKAEMDGGAASKVLEVASAPLPAAPLVMKCPDPPNGGLLRNGGILLKSRNYKAGSKINLLADMLAKRSLQLVNGDDTSTCAPTEPLPFIKPAEELKTEEVAAVAALAEAPVANPAEVPAEAPCASPPPPPIPVEPDKPVEQPDPSTAFNESEKSTNEKPQKTRTSPRSRKEVPQTEKKPRKPPKRRKLLVETSTQTAEAPVEPPEPVAVENVPPPVIAPEEALAMVITSMSKLPEFPTFVCLFCHLTFAEKTDCLNHEATHSLKRKTKFIKCQFCSKKLPNLEDFKTHSTEYHGPNFILCTECDLRFLNHESLVLHTRTNHHTYEHVERAQYTILNKKVRTGGALDIDVSYESGKKQTLSPRCGQKLSPKEKTEEQLYEAEMLFYSHLSGNIQENLSKHLDGKINLENDVVESNLLAVAPAPTLPPRAPSPYQTRSKTPNPLPTSAKKFKKLPNWQQKFWEKYNFPTNYRFEHRFWDKNYITTEKSAFYLKDLSCLDIKTQLTMRENVKKLEESTPEEENERLKDSFPYCLNLAPGGRTVAKPAPVVPQAPKVVKKGAGKGRKKELAGTPQVVTRRQSGIGNEGKKMTLRRQTSQEIVGVKNGSGGPEPSTSKEVVIDDTEVLEPSVISGEWVRPRSYLCGTCCARFSNFWELDDHKWVAHPNVSCTHYEFEDEKLEKVFQLDAPTPDIAPIKLSDLYQRSLLPQGSLLTSETVAVTSFPHPCSKCHKLSASQADLHRHMLDCGGDTTWATTMTASPATLKRRWRPYRSRRRKQIGQRGVKRTIPPTPPLRKYSLQPKVRTKPGDVETIQKMLANLPEKRTRRAINFDAVNTRSQTTIHSNRLLRKRFNTTFGSNFLRRKAISTARQRQLKADSISSTSISTSPSSMSEESSTSTPAASPRRRIRLKEVTVSVTPLPEMMVQNQEPVKKTEIVKRKGKKVAKKVVKEAPQEQKPPSPTPQPTEKQVNKKIVARKGYLVRKIKKRLINSKKFHEVRKENRRRSGRLNQSKDEEEGDFTVEESSLPIAKLTGAKKLKRKPKKTELEVLGEMPSLNKEEFGAKRRSGRRTEPELPVLEPVAVVKKVRKGRVVKPKTTPETQPPPVDSPSDTEPLIAFKATKKKVVKRKGKRVVKPSKPVLPVENPVQPVEDPVPPLDNPVQPVEDPVPSVADPVLPVETPDKVAETFAMMERIITDKLNERIGKRSKGISRHRKTRQPNLKRLRMTVTLKEATLKVLDKPAAPLAPNKWTVTSPDQLTAPTTFVPLASPDDENKDILKNGLVKAPVVEPEKPVEAEPPFVVPEPPVEPPVVLTEPEVVEEKVVTVPEVVKIPDVVVVSTSVVEEVKEPIVKPSVMPIFTIEEATSSEDATKPTRSEPKISEVSRCEPEIAEATKSTRCEPKIAEADSSVLESEMVVSSTEPTKVKATRKRRERLVETNYVESKDEVPSSTLVIPEELDRRSRRRSKEVPRTNEFVIDDPLLLVDELWSDLDSDSDSKNRKVKRVKKRTPRKRPAKQKVDLEAILRNFGESKDSMTEEKIKRLPAKRADPEQTSLRAKIERKLVPAKHFLRKLSLNLFSHKKKVIRHGHYGEKLMVAKSQLQSFVQPKIEFLATEVTENPEQVIVCRSTKPKGAKKQAKEVVPEAKPAPTNFKISLPLELIGDLSMLNNNHLTCPDIEPEEPIVALEPVPTKTTETKQKRNEVIDKIFYCEICKTYYYSPSQLKNHKMSNRHKLKEAEMLGTAPLSPEETQAQETQPQEEPEEPEPEPEPVKAEVEPVLSEVDKNGEDSSEMPVLEGPFIETRPEPIRTEPTVPVHHPQSQPSLFGFSEESLKDIQQAIGCTDEEMLILTLLGENTVPEPDILDISNLTSKAEEEKRESFDALVAKKTNGVCKIDLKQRMTTALASLVNRAVTNLMSKSETKTADNPDAMTFLNKLSGISGRRRSVTEIAVAEAASVVGEEVRYKYQCTICGNRFEKESTRDNHMVRTHKVGKRSRGGSGVTKIELDDGPVNDDQWSESWYEPDEDEEPTQFWCSDCGINFLSPQEVSDHQKAEHPPAVPVPPAPIVEVEEPQDLSTTAKPITQRRTSQLNPEQAKLIANQELQKLVARRRFRTTKFLYDTVSYRKLSPKPQDPVKSETESVVGENKEVDIYDFNEFDSDPEPVVLSHVRKSGLKEPESGVEPVEKDTEVTEPELGVLSKIRKSGAKAKEVTLDSDSEPIVSPATRKSYLKEKEPDTDPELVNLSKSRKSYLKEAEPITEPSLVRKSVPKVPPASEFDDSEPVVSSKSRKSYLKAAEPTLEPDILSHVRKSILKAKEASELNDSEPIMPSKSRKSYLKETEPVTSSRVRKSGLKEPTLASESNDLAPLISSKSRKPYLEEKESSPEPVLSSHIRRPGLKAKEQTLASEFDHAEPIVSSKSRKSYLKEPSPDPSHVRKSGQKAAPLSEFDDPEPIVSSKSRKSYLKDLETTPEPLSLLRKSGSAPEPEQIVSSKVRKSSVKQTSASEFDDLEPIVPRRNRKSSAKAKEQSPVLEIGLEPRMSNILKPEPIIRKSGLKDPVPSFEFDDDEPILVRKTGLKAKEPTPASESDDDLPLSSVKRPRLSDDVLPEPEDGLLGKESFKISLQNRFLDLDELAVKKTLLAEDEAPDVLTKPLHEDFDHDSDDLDDNVIYQRNDSSDDASLQGGFSDASSGSEGEEKGRRKIVPLLSATLTDSLQRKSESPKIDKEVIVKRIWSRQKLKPSGEDSDIDKETIMKKVWRKKKGDESQEDVKISQTEISNEVVIQCGPKPKLNRRKSATEPTAAKDAIVRRIWTGKCGFQTKAALKTYETDVVVPIPVETPTPCKRRGRPASMSAVKRKKDDSDSEDDLKSLLDEIEQENVEKAIRREFLHLRRTEKSQVESPKEPSGLFTEIQPSEVVPEKKRKVRKVVKRRPDFAELRNRRHRKHRHRHHHHKHKHKKSRHHKGGRHREEAEAPFRILERMCTDLVPKGPESPATPTPEPWSASGTVVTSDLDTLQLKIDEILSPYDCPNKSS